MKKILALVLALVMILSLCACGKKAEAPADINAKSEGVMTYAEYAAAAIDSEVTIEAYVQAHQSWWDNSITVYAADGDGAYFLYDMACSEEDSAKLVPGTKIKVTGYKSEWAGEVEIVDSTFEIMEGSYIAQPVDLTAVFGTDALIDYQNQFFSVKGAVIEDAGNGTAFMYKWDDSGSDGDDLYFNVNIGGNTYSFSVESYLTGAGTDVYEGVKGLQIGQTVDLEGFLYWYDSVNPHITGVKAA